MEAEDISIHHVAEIWSWNFYRISPRSAFKDNWMQDCCCSVCYECESPFHIYDCYCDHHVCENTVCGDSSQDKFFTTNGCSKLQTGGLLHLCKLFNSPGVEDFTYCNAGKALYEISLFNLSSINSVLKGLCEYLQWGLTGFQLFSGGDVMDTELETKNCSQLIPSRTNIRLLSPKGTEGSPSPNDFCNDSRSYGDDDYCQGKPVFYSPRYHQRLEEDVGDDGSAHMPTCASDGTTATLKLGSPCSDQQSGLSIGYSEEPEDGLEENSFYASLYKEPSTSKEKGSQPDIENNGLLWAAPLPESGEDQYGSSGEEDDNDTECWGLYSPDGSSSSSKCKSKESLPFAPWKDVKAVVNGYFRLVVGQLLNREGLQADEGGPESWLEVITRLSLEAASVVKPDTSVGGGMDPGIYVKVKSVATGRPTESRVVSGIVCEKNLAHKRMTTRYKPSKLLLLGGSLELPVVSDRLSSFETLLQKETADHLSLAVSRIEAHHPNVLLVERTVSRQAQERILEKGISLVLNIKRPLLERIARCTGATIVSNLEHLASAKVGLCGQFFVEKYLEEHGSAGQEGRKLMKTLMFFEDCPKPFGCSILLKGRNADELKKVKRAVKLAVFAAYHLALETSFLADEGVDFPELRPTSPLNLALPAKTDSSISSGSGFLPSKSVQEKNPAQICTVSLGSLSISSAFANSTTDQGISIFRDGSPGPSVSLASMSSSVSSKVNSHLSSPFKVGENSHGGDSVQPSTGSQRLGLQEVIGATLGKLSAAMASEDFGQGVLGFAATVRETFSAKKSSESSSAINESSDNKLFLTRKDATLPVSEGSQNLLLSASSEKKRTNSPAFGALSMSETSNGDNDAADASREDFPPSPSNHQSILVSFSSSCLRKGTICERGHLFRIKYYGTFDRPLGGFLRENLFDLSKKCQACGESKDAHVDCYTHRQGCLTIRVRQQTQSLAGESAGKIWMWHRCLRCNPVDGIPPASRRIVMSDAAWGLSFGKFLELSFSNHAAASRVASCGHSLHRDCLRYYGFGNTTACIRYSPVNVYSVYLPPSKLDFHCVEHQKWLQQEIREIEEKGDHLFKDISKHLQHVRDGTANMDGRSQEVKSHILELKGVLIKQEDSFKRALREAGADQPHADILQLNYIRRCLSKCSSLWDNRIQCLSSSLKSPRSFPTFDSALIGDSILSFLKEISFGSGRNRKSDSSQEVSVTGSPDSSKLEHTRGSGLFVLENSKPTAGLIYETTVDVSNKEVESVAAMSKPVALASSVEGSLTFSSPSSFEGSGSGSTKLLSGMGNRPYSSWPANTTSTVNSANVFEGQMGRSLSEGHFSTTKDVSATFDAAWTGEGQTQDDMPSMEKVADTSDFISLSEFSSNDCISRSTSEISDVSSLDQRLGNLYLTSTLTSPSKAGQPSNIEGWVGAPYLSFSRRHNDGGSFTSCSPPKAAQFSSTLLERSGTQERITMSLLPGADEAVVSVYDDEPTSVIAYAITSQEHQVHLFDKSGDKERDVKEKDKEKMLPFPIGIGIFHAFQSLDGKSEHGSANSSTSYESLSDDPMLDSKACHVKVNFSDDTLQGKIKYAVVCYYAKQFDCLRKKCCPDELDFIRSLCRCKKWGAQGGKSNVFFAKTADDRFVVKQITRTELDSFLTFAPAYFKHISEALITGSPTCLAKILGIYQVRVKHAKGGKEVRMDLMIMENLLYGRRATRVYDLKGSLRSRYNADATAKDAVLLDQNLLDSLQSNPIFISNKAKRLLERAIWNDTAFLASVDVMDYSLLVGVDEDKGDLVLGIIDFMRQYTWDKHLETWVKTSGILGGPRNATPTVISPMQYKKRFRKAMSTYFLMVPDQWLPDTVISSLPYHEDIDDHFLAALGDQSLVDCDTGRV